MNKEKTHTLSLFLINFFSLIIIRVIPENGDISFRISIFRSIEISSFPLFRILDDLSAGSSNSRARISRGGRHERGPPWKMEGSLNYWGWRAARSCPRNQKRPSVCLLISSGTRCCIKRSVCLRNESNRHNHCGDRCGSSFLSRFFNLTAPPCFSNVARRCFLDACPPYLEKATLLSLEKKIEWKILLNSLWIW